MFYDNDDGIRSDAGGAGRHWIWYKSVYKAFVSLLRANSEELSSGITKLDTCRTFQAYVGLNDTMYFNLNHGVNWRSFQHSIDQLRESQQSLHEGRLPVIALGARDSLFDNPGTFFYPTIAWHIKFLAARVLLVIGDTCCENNQRHRKTLELVELKSVDGCEARASCIKDEMMSELLLCYQSLEPGANHPHYSCKDKPELVGLAIIRRT